MGTAIPEEPELPGGARGQSSAEPSKLLNSNIYLSFSQQVFTGKVLCIRLHLGEPSSLPSALVGLTVYCSCGAYCHVPLGVSVHMCVVGGGGRR